MLGAVVLFDRTMGYEVSVIRELFRRNRLHPEDPVGTSRQVLAGSSVGTVIHQHDGSWQFQCVNSKEPDDIRIVHFHDIIALDPSMQQFEKLPKGMVAILDSGAWRRLYFETDIEIDEFFGAV